MRLSLDPKQTQHIILALVMALMLGAAALISTLAMTEFTRVLSPELNKKGERLAESVRSLLVKSLNYGVPLHRLNGTREYFDGVLNEHQEARYLALTTPDGKLLYASSQLPKSLLLPFFHQHTTTKTSHPIGSYLDLALPLMLEGQQRATIHLGLDNNFLTNRLQEIGYDILTVLVIAFVFTFELLILIFSTLINSPIQTINARLNNIAQGSTMAMVQSKGDDPFSRIHQRLNQLSTIITPQPPLANKKQSPPVAVRGLLFLFIFAAMFPVAFLPMYIAQLYQPLGSLSKEFTLSLPFAAYYLASALAIAYAGPWSERVGRRQPMLSGALLSALSLLGCAVASNIWLFTLGYCLAAVGFGLVMVACQGAIIDQTPATQRTSAMAHFWAGFFAGTLCGTGMGAILAQHIGPAPTLLVAALSSLVCAIVMARLMPPGPTSQTIPKKNLRWQQLRRLLANGRFLALVFGISVPAKICMTGFMFYLIPKFLTAQDINQASIGRILMLYSLMFIFVGPGLSRLLEGRLSQRRLTIGATLLAGLALLFVVWQADVVGVLLAVGLYALFRASSSPASTSLLLEVSSQEVEELGAATVIAIATLFERLGNIAGPILAGLLLALFGFPGALASFGILTLAGALLALTSRAVNP